MAAEYTERDREPDLYDELSKFTTMMRDRLEREREQAAALIAQAESARRQADATKQVYEAVARLHEAMANRPEDRPLSFAYTVPFDEKPYRVT